jgi:hypothetical protein
MKGGRKTVSDSEHNGDDSCKIIVQKVNEVLQKLVKLCCG